MPGRPGLLRRCEPATIIVRMPRWRCRRALGSLGGAAPWRNTDAILPYLNFGRLRPALGAVATRAR